MNKIIIKRLVFILLCIIAILYLTSKGNRISFSKEQYSNILCINEIMINNRSSYKDDDSDYESWVEIYNMSNKHINLKDFGLTNNNEDLFKWSFPDVTINPKSYLIVWISGKNKLVSTDELHTNFKLKPNDDILILSSPNGHWNDILHIQKTSDNISYGRKPSGIGEFYTFEDGTPGSDNNIDSLVDGVNAKRLDEPQFSLSGGLYNKKFYLSLTTTVENSNIYYTLDGSEPTKDSLLYNKPIEITPKKNAGTIVRAILYKEGYQKSNIVTSSYFVDESFLTSYNIPIVSVVTDPKNLFDYNDGIYVAGEIYDNWIEANYSNTNPVIRNLPANFTQKGKKWERKAHIEIFEKNKETSINQNIGIRIFGGYTRQSIVKSLSLYARHTYDDKDTFNYEFSNSDKLDSYSPSLNKLLLRTPATDYNGALFRDDLIQSLVPPTLNLKTQKSQTCIVFINGEYYGLHSIKEAYNKEFFYSYYNIPLDDVVILKNPTGVAGIEVSEGFAGDEMHYNKMHNFIEHNDMSITENYEYVKTLLDIENFIEYNILQIYCANRDWPSNNVKVWRKRTQSYEPSSAYGHDGRWRYLVFDLDYGLGLYTVNTPKYDFDMLKFATEHNGPVWPNPSWSTIMLRKLLENKEFKELFIRTFLNRLNTIYSEQEVYNKILAYETLYSPYVKEHIDRWNIFKGDITLWENQINILKEFALNRPKYVRQHIMEYFNLSLESKLQISDAQVIAVD